MEIRRRIATVLDRAIFENIRPESRKIGAKTIRPFVEGRLKLTVTQDFGQRHLIYGTYGEQSAHKALKRILDGDWAFTDGKTLGQALEFEASLLKFVREHDDFLGEDIPFNVFRRAYNPEQKLPYATNNYLIRGEDHAEFLCRRFLDVCADKPHVDMDIGDRQNVGLVALLVLDTYHANDEDHGKIVFADLFDNKISVTDSIVIGSRTWPVQRICPLGKPTLSQSSIGGDVRKRYSGIGVQMFEENIQILQKRILNDFLNLTVYEIFGLIVKINNFIENRFNSGSLNRTVLDVEKGAIFINQAAHGRFWLFGFCPIQSKVAKADSSMLNKIVKYYENASMK